MFDERVAALSEIICKTLLYLCYLSYLVRRKMALRMDPCERWRFLNLGSQLAFLNYRHHQQNWMFLIPEFKEVDVIDLRAHPPAGMHRIVDAPH